MEHSPKNVHYLRIIGSILLVIAFVFSFFAYKTLYNRDVNNRSYILFLIGLLSLSILSFTNAYSTFKFSSNISRESFDKWQLVQKRFWLAIAFIIIPFMLLVLFVLCIIISIGSINGFN